MKLYGYTGFTNGKTHVIVNQREADDPKVFDAHLGSACGRGFDGFLVPENGILAVDKCAHCFPKEA